MIKSSLTKMNERARIALASKTEAGSAEAQPARDSRLKATNCRWDGSSTPAIPFQEQRQFRALPCLEKPDKMVPQKADSVSAKDSKSMLTVKWFCPIHAEPIQHL